MQLQFLLWQIVAVATTVFNDIIAVLALISSGLIMLSSVIRLITNKRMFNSSQLLFVAFLSLAVGFTGFVAKMLDDSLVSGFLLRLGNIQIGILLLVSLFMLIVSIGFLGLLRKKNKP